MAFDKLNIKEVKGFYKTKMKRLFTLSVAVFLACIAVYAQEAAIEKAMKRYKDVHALTASVMRTKHNVAVVDDAVTEGKLYFKAPGKMCMIFEECNDMLLMDDGEFTMVNAGQPSVARGKTKEQFDILVAVFKESVLGLKGSESVGAADVKVTNEGNRFVLTVTPDVAGNAKTRRRMLFSSFELTVDLRAGEFKSLRMNERGGNYTQYDFTGFVLNGDVSDEVFRLLSLAL